MKAKTILIGAGLAIVGVALLGYTKVTDLQWIFSKMTIKPVAIRKIKISFSSISFNLDIQLTNPTTQDFAVNGYGARLTKVIVSKNGKPLGVSIVNMGEISVPAYGSFVIKDVPVIVIPSVVLENLDTIFQTGIEDLQISSVIEVLGEEYVITQ